LKSLTTTAYLVGWQLVLLIAIGGIFLGIYQINIYIMYLVKKTKWLPVLIAASSVTSVGINYLLIPRIGIMGAAISNIAAYFVLASTVSIWASKTIQYGIDLKHFAKVVAASTVMALCLHFLKIDNAQGIVLSVVIGAVVFGMILFLLGGLSFEDKQIIRQLIKGIIPRKPPKEILKKLN
jgi:O-antigen/teichoic acid export membrane protein